MKEKITAKDKELPTIEKDIKDSTFTMQAALDELINKIGKNVFKENHGFRLYGTFGFITLPDTPGQFRITVILKGDIPDKIAIEDYTNPETISRKWDEFSVTDKEAMLDAVIKNGKYR